MSAPERKAVTYQLRTTQAWLDRVDVEAEHLGISRAAYIRMAVSERLDRDEAKAQRQPKPRP